VTTGGSGVQSGEVFAAARLSPDIGDDDDDEID
jgi:hypothetical protein